jgi:hypothetical protein
MNVFTSILNNINVIKKEIVINPLFLHPLKTHWNLFSEFFYDREFMDNILYNTINTQDNLNQLITMLKLPCYILTELENCKENFLVDDIIIEKYSKILELLPPLIDKIIEPDFTHWQPSEETLIFILPSGTLMHVSAYNNEIKMVPELSQIILVSMETNNITQLQIVNGYPDIPKSLF